MGKNESIMWAGGAGRHTVGANTRCAWAGGTCANYPDFFENHQFHVIFCVTLAYFTFFEEFLIHNSHRRFMILKNN
jgi:hypothetical protein